MRSNKGRAAGAADVADNSQLGAREYTARFLTKEKEKYNKKCRRKAASNLVLPSCLQIYLSLRTLDGATWAGQPCHAAWCERSHDGQRVDGLCLFGAGRREGKRDPKRRSLDVKREMAVATAAVD